MIYKETIVLSAAKVQKYEEYMNSVVLSEDETIYHSAIFPNGYVMDIKVCGCQDDEAYAEAVLFRPTGNGALTEVACSDVCDTVVGEWVLNDGDDEYHVVVCTDSSHLFIVSQGVNSHYDGTSLCEPVRFFNKQDAVSYVNRRMSEIKEEWGEDGDEWETIWRADTDIVLNHSDYRDVFYFAIHEIF